MFDDVAKALMFDEAGLQRVVSNIAALKEQLPGAMQQCLAYFPRRGPRAGAATRG